MLDENRLMLFMASMMRKGVREDLQKLKELLVKQDTDA
jgi:hypothetical protein